MDWALEVHDHDVRLQESGIPVQASQMDRHTLVYAISKNPEALCTQCSVDVSIVSVYPNPVTN